MAVMRQNKLIVTLIAISLGALMYSCLPGNAGRQVANKTFQFSLKGAILKADEFQIFKRVLNKESHKEELVLVKTYKEAQPGFRLLSKGFKNAKDEGVIAKSIADRRIVFLSRGKNIFRINYCTADGRMEGGPAIGGHPGMLFLPEYARKYVD